MPSQTHPEVCFTNPLGISQSNHVDIQINHHSPLCWWLGCMSIVLSSLELLRSLLYLDMVRIQSILLNKGIGVILYSINGKNEDLETQMSYSTRPESWVTESWLYLALSLKKRSRNSWEKGHGWEERNFVSISWRWREDGDTSPPGCGEGRKDRVTCLISAATGDV